MKQFEKFYVTEDSDCEDYPTSRPLVKTRVIVAALVSIAVVLFVGSIVWKLFV